MEDLLSSSPPSHEIAETQGFQTPPPDPEFSVQSDEHSTPSTPEQTPASKKARTVTSESTPPSTSTLPPRTVQQSILYVFIS